MAFFAATSLGIPFQDVTAIDVLPDPSPVWPDRAHRAFLRLSSRDKHPQEYTISCPGVAGGSQPECMPDPVVPLGWPQRLMDLPGDATPFPAIDPAVKAGGVPLRIATLVVPITRLGTQKVVLGQATLPNGVLTEATFELGDPWPAGVLFNGGIKLVAEPVGGGPAFTDQWLHGWREGVETFDLRLAFDVGWFEPGATFTVVNLIFR